MYRDNLMIKICGMRQPDNVSAVAAMKPDYMGFIFYERSPRYVSTPPPTDNVLRVGVFVNATVEDMLMKVREHHLDLVQLHGDESPDVCNALKTNGLSVIKVFRVDSGFNFDLTTEYESVADFFLFDTKGEKYGGNAVPFDWSVLSRYNQRMPFFLSGGLDANKMLSLGDILQMNIHALDLNSGVEVSPGVKDIQKVQEAINNLKKINTYGIPGR